MYNLVPKLHSTATWLCDTQPVCDSASQDIKHFIVLVMELCEYDLDYMVKTHSFKEADITLFLHQLGGCSRVEQFTNGRPIVRLHLDDMRTAICIFVPSVVKGSSVETKM